MTTITTTPSSNVGRGPLVIGTVLVGLAVVGALTVPRLTSTNESSPVDGRSTTVTTAMAGGPDALALHRSTSGVVAPRNGLTPEQHVFGRPAVGSPGLIGPHALDPRAWTTTTSYTGSAYAPGGSMYRLQVPTVREETVGTDGPTSPDAAERWASGSGATVHAVPKRGYR